MGQRSSVPSHTGSWGARAEDQASICKISEGEHRIQGSLRNVEMLATIPPGSRDRGSPMGAAGPDQGFLRTVAVRSGRAEEVPEELRGALLELGRGDPMMVGSRSMAGGG